MKFVCLDMEGVLTPELWKQVAKNLKVTELELTTRDIPDYSMLMDRRLKIMHEHGIGISALQDAVEMMQPLPGAVDFLRWLNEKFQYAIVSDTFYQIAQPLMRQLSYPLLFCNHLQVDEQGKIVGYQLRQEQQKVQVVQAVQKLNYQVFATGDSYNDLGMLRSADAAAFFCPADAARAEYPELPVANNYEELQDLLLQFQATT